MTRKPTHNDSLGTGAPSAAILTLRSRAGLRSASMKDETTGVAAMITYGEWITKSVRIGALLGGISGFFYAAYITVTSPGLNWTDGLDMMGSVMAVLLYAIVLGSFCIAIGGLAGLALGFVSSPLSSFTKNARILPFRVGRQNIEKRERAS